jgi:hypothetical protein
LLDAGGVQQNIATTLGKNYRIDFNVSANSDGLPANKTMYAEIAGVHTPYTINSGVYSNGRGY